MKKIMLSMFRILLLVVILSGITTASWSEDAPYTVQLKTKDISGHVGERLTIRIDPETKNLPSGFMYTVTADGTTYPGSEAPEILPGVPVTSVTCRFPGEYLIRIRVNLVFKTSCGGAMFNTILEDEVRLHVSEG